MGRIHAILSDGNVVRDVEVCMHTVIPVSFLHFPELIFVQKLVKIIGYPVLWGKSLDFKLDKIREKDQLKRSVFYWMLARFEL